MARRAVTNRRLPGPLGMRRTLLGTAVVAFALLALAPAAMSGESVAPTLTVKSSSFGRVLFDGRGYVLYAFTRDKNGRSAC
jgi:predicted lipoprotein with Yx(FWY)xxD motif